MRPGKAPRPVAGGLVYHALNRGNDRRPVLAGAADYRAFPGALAQAQRRYPFRLDGYCLMTNPFHLLLEPQAGPSPSSASSAAAGAARTRATSGSAPTWP